MTKKIVLPSLIGIIALALVFGAWNIGTAYAQTPTQTPSTTTPGADSPRGERVGVTQQGLADALGISLADLQAAYTSANTEYLKQAVEQGLLTQAQADEITARGLSGGQIRGFKHGIAAGATAAAIDYDALLAKALGITTDQLTAVRQKALATAVDAAVAAGTLTQAQADLIQGRAALAADSNFQSAMQSAYAAAVQQAVSSGVITQAQADAILQAQQNGSGRGFFGGFGLDDGFGGKHGRGGGFHGTPDGADSDTAPTTTPTGSGA